ncbi:C-terminal binding protein [Kordiimonas sp.]|uniref:C-terminal binding protein n=1 Tax=Kordiimonas sp. TaxID=1970157 RepID=UPI003A9309C6
MKIGITDYVAAPGDIEQEALGGDAELVFLNAIHAQDFDDAQLAQVEALLVWHAHIDRDVIARLKKCRVVVRYGVGYDNIDVAGLEEAGIIFCNTPDYGTEEVADTATAMALALARAIGQYDFKARKYHDSWQENTVSGIKRLSTTTLGVIGVGRIGSSVMRRMRPFGVRLVGYDPHLPSGHEKALGYERAHSLDALLQQADIVSVHCPLTPQTSGMINPAFLGAMQPGGILVNTARGGLIADLDPLHDALESGHLAGLGLDVLPQEPPLDDKLTTAWRRGATWLQGRLIINPHTAYYSEQAWREMRYKAAETAKLVLTGGPIRNRIRPADVA